MEVLRATGIRIEELLELSHHSLVQYRLPGTGELIPLLQIAPSKTDKERLLVVSPELADVLSQIIRRVRDHCRGPARLRLRRLRAGMAAPGAAPVPAPRQRREPGVRSQRHLKMLRAAAHPTRAGQPGRPPMATPRMTSAGYSSPTPSSMACPLTSPRSSPATRTSTSPSATRPSIPKRQSRRTCPSWPGGGRCGPARNTASPPTPNGASSSATSSGARSPSGPAPGRSPPPASTSTPASAARCSGPTRTSGPAWPTSATTCSPASPKPSTKAGSAKSKDCASASPEPTTSSPRSTGAPSQPPPSTSPCPPCNTLREATITSPTLIISKFREEHQPQVPAGPAPWPASAAARTSPLAALTPSPATVRPMQPAEDAG